MCEQGTKHGVFISQWKKGASNKTSNHPISNRQRNSLRNSPCEVQIISESTWRDYRLSIKYIHKKYNNNQTNHNENCTSGAKQHARYQAMLEIEHSGSNSKFYRGKWTLSRNLGPSTGLKKGSPPTSKVAGSFDSYLSFDVITSIKSMESMRACTKKCPVTLLRFALPYVTFCGSTET